MGTYGTLRRVFLDEGIRGLYRGITPAILCHVPAAGLFFTTYSFVKPRVPTLPQMHHSSTLMFQSAWAAASAWVVTCTVVNPLFVLKTKQQTQLVRKTADAPLKYTGLIASGKVVLREQGIRGLYAGFSVAVMGFPGAMAQMSLYERLKRTEDGTPPTPERIAVASSASSAIVGLITYPVEVIRLRLQAQGPATETDHYVGFFDGFRKIVKNEGFRSFYRGCGTSLIRSVPQSAIGLCTYETVLRFVTSFIHAADG